MILKYEIQFFVNCQLQLLTARLIRLASLIIPSWHYINHNCICTIGKVLKNNEIYAYKESGYVDIVRLLDAYIDKGYLYCNLYFLKRNKIITVCQTMQKNASILWKLMDNKEFDEIMSIKLWKEVSEQDELLEFDFGK